MHKIPTNIISGFLGSGKTTAILDLLNKKPANEYWAILVNEFGQVGIDGAFLSEQGALVKEVPGGCMCCVAGLPMSVGLNALIEQKPDRIILEPTGLGHPQKILGKLRSEAYSQHIEVFATITLVDPRNLADPLFAENDNFKAQIALADVIVGNKTDLCQTDDLAQFTSRLSKITSDTQHIELTQQGRLKLDRLKLDAKQLDIGSHHDHDTAPVPGLEIPPGERYIRKENSGQGYRSCGWFFDNELTFDFSKIFQLFSQLSAQRVKAVINTERGCIAFNVVNQVVSVNELSLDGFESRVEVIDRQPLPWDELEQYLLASLTTPLS
ncbi:CobW family GTP-binding protein [Thaumasiovibrio sp. DFM-14]|uniref:CobW family GTP-binding protein n=1 Tax=Thaumasiovibrio sp. DFM-14 TaxID=3384792 RepID=UPI0039A2C955